MADYSTDNLKQSQQFLQAYDKILFMIFLPV